MLLQIGNVKAVMCRHQHRCRHHLLNVVHFCILCIDHLVCTYYDLKQPFDYSKSSIQGFHNLKKSVWQLHFTHIQHMLKRRRVSYLLLM